MVFIMSGKFEEMINNAKITELLNKKKAEEENKSFVLWILAIIGAVAAVAAIAFAVYRYMNPKYADFNGDFDLTSLRMISKMTTLMIMTFM